jgi:p-aminobenzoyl-glutamate transporter AbgT
MYGNKLTKTSKLIKNLVVFILMMFLIVSVNYKVTKPV